MPGRGILLTPSNIFNCYWRPSALYQGKQTFCHRMPTTRTWSCLRPQSLTLHTLASSSAGIKEICIKNHLRILGHTSSTGNLSHSTAVYHQNTFNVQMFTGCAAILPPSYDMTRSNTMNRANSSLLTTKPITTLCRLLEKIILELTVFNFFPLMDHEAKLKELLPAAGTLEDNTYNYVTVTTYFSQKFLAITLSPGMWVFSLFFFFVFLLTERLHRRKTAKKHVWSLFA